MTTENLGLEQPAVEDPAPVDEQAAVEQPVEQEAAAEAEDEQVEGVVEFRPNEKYVPLSAVIEARRATKEAKEKLKELEPASAEAKQLREYLQQAQPYIEFLKANPDFLRPRETAPTAAPQPADDTEAAEYAKEFDLYTADGKPDAARARRIIAKNAQIAEAAAQRANAPVAEQMESQAVYTVLYQLGQETDGDGHAINPQAINNLAQHLLNSLGQKGARQFLANPQSYEMLKSMAWGNHVKIPKKATVKPPEHPPLQTERAGGKGEEVSVSTQHLGRLGIKEDAYKASAKGFKLGQPNVLE